MIEWREDNAYDGKVYDPHGKRVLGVRFDSARWFGIFFLSTDAADMEILEACSPARPRFVTADEAKRWAEETYTGFRAAATLRRSR